MLLLVSLTRKTIETPALQMSRSCTENFETVKFMPEIISKSPAMQQESVNTTQTFRRALFRDDFRITNRPCRILYNVLRGL